MFCKVSPCVPGLSLAPQPPERPRLGELLIAVHGVAVGLPGPQRGRPHGVLVHGGVGLRSRVVGRGDAVAGLTPIVTVPVIHRTVGVVICRGEERGRVKTGELTVGLRRSLWGVFILCYHSVDRGSSSRTEGSFHCAACEDGDQLCRLGGRGCTWGKVRPVTGTPAHGAARAYVLAERALWRPLNKCHSGRLTAVPTRWTTWLPGVCLRLKLHTGKTPQLESVLSTNCL